MYKSQAQRGDPKIVRFLARECGCGVDAKDNDGTTPLMAAADYARDAAVRELLALGADAAVAKPDGTRAVHRAASSALSSGPVDDPNSIAAASATEALIDADAEKDVFLNCPSDVGTPFLCACARGAEATARMLTAKGADARAVTPAGVGAATLAASSGVLGALAAALDAGAPTAAPSQPAAPNNATCGLLRDLRMSSRNLTRSAGGVACNARNSNAPCFGDTSSALSKNCN